MTTEDPLDEDQAIAASLHATWDAFFARFGRLTPIQRAAIPPILAGNDVLVTAPTATGKTEAACAPLIERSSSVALPWTILYVSPTRALVNDLYERLFPPVSRLGLRIGRRTGDHREGHDSKPNVLLTTPESFDSMLCRGRTQESHLLAAVAAVVLDEIHLLHGTPRGAQVRWLLERLRRLRTQARREGWSTHHGVQVVALSATVSDPEDVAATYLTDGRHIAASGDRLIETAGVECGSPAIEHALPAYLETSGASEKVLVFSNARKRVDRLATDLRRTLETMRYDVRAHHGSLSQEERESTERRIKEGSRVVVIATSTLELGIDIGDIDLVVLDGPAPSVSSLLQRIGRGNRRTDRTRVLACANSLAEVLIQSAMLAAARQGILGPTERGPSHAVARQQVASYIFQAPGRRRQPDVIVGFLTTWLSEHFARSLLEHLILTRELETDGEGVRLGAIWLETTSTGEIHSNIEAAAGSTVVDYDTGAQIAQGIRFKGGNGLQVAGNLLHVRERTDWHLGVRRVRDERLAQGEWSYVTSAWMQGAGQPAAVRRFLGIGDREWPLLHVEGGTVVFHFGGARRKAILGLLLARSGISHSGVRINEWFLRVPFHTMTIPSWILSSSAASLELSISGRVPELERALARPQANQFLPMDLRLAELREWLSLQSELDAIRQAEWAPVSPEDVAAALQVLYEGISRKRPT